MPSNAVLYRIPQGIPGCISRQGFSQVEGAIQGATPFPAYGMPVKLVSGLIVPLAVVSDTLPYGWLVRPFPTQGNNPSDPLGAGVPLAGVGVLVSVMVKGYMTVLCQANPGSAAAGGQVYLRYANPAGAAIVGGIESTAIGATTVALLNCRFMGPADGAGNVEIYFDTI